ncbi:uncharacterized protein [Bos indicus]|uniref:Basic proline-rich protein-like n=1 Tax=Bos indicus TaxID=9915 RepID=A0ABM4SKU0_BOSIN
MIRARPPDSPGLWQRPRAGRVPASPASLSGALSPPPPPPSSSPGASSASWRPSASPTCGRPRGGSPRLPGVPLKGSRASLSRAPRRRHPEPPPRAGGRRSRASGPAAVRSALGLARPRGESPRLPGVRLRGSLVVVVDGSLLSEPAAAGPAAVRSALGLPRLWPPARGESPPPRRPPQGLSRRAARQPPQEPERGPPVPPAPLPRDWEPTRNTPASGENSRNSSADFYP